MQNEVQYDLDRKSAKISALSSNNLDKQEYLTGEDLGLKPSTVEEAEFDYSPLSKIFNKGLSEDDKKEGLFKRLENIKDKSENQSKKQLDAIKKFNISSKPLKEISFFSTLNYNAKKLMIKIKQLDNWFDSAQLICTKTDGKTIYNFSNFTFPFKFASKIYNKYITLQDAENNQQELKILINKLNNSYNPKINIKRKEKKDTLKSANKLFIIREEIIKAFKNGIFLYIDNKVEKESEEESEEEESKEKKLDENEFLKNIEDESKAFNYELFEKHFNNVVPSALAKKLSETKK